MKTLTPQEEKAGSAKKNDGDLEALRRDMNDVKDGDYCIQAENIKRILRLIDGDADLKAKGMWQMIQELHSSVTEMQEERKQQKTLMRGIVIGLGLTGITGIGTLVTLLAQVMGAFK